MEPGLFPDVTLSSPDLAHLALRATVDREVGEQVVLQCAAIRRQTQAQLDQQKATATLMSAQMLNMAANTRKLERQLESCEFNLQMETELSAKLHAQLRSAEASQMQGYKVGFQAGAVSLPSASATPAEQSKHTLLEVADAYGAQS